MNEWMRFISAWWSFGNRLGTSFFFISGRNHKLINSECRIVAWWTFSFLLSHHPNNDTNSDSKLLFIYYYGFFWIRNNNVFHHQIDDMTNLINAVYLYSHLYSKVLNMVETLLPTKSFFFVEIPAIQNLKTQLTQSRSKGKKIQ